MDGMYPTASLGPGGSHGEQSHSLLHKRKEDTQLAHLQGLPDDKILRQEYIKEHCHLGGGGGGEKFQQMKGENKCNQQVKTQNQNNPEGEEQRQNQQSGNQEKENQQCKQVVNKQGEIQRNPQNQQAKGKKQKMGGIGENHQRMNYLLQVSHWLCQKERKMARNAGSLAMSIGRKCLIRMDPLLKRSLCKGCGVVLIYGINATVRFRKKRQKHLVITCHNCRTIKRFVNDSKYRLWTLCNEAKVE
ncbi:ribonuclease P protein subunit Rpp21 [Oratosquilla oratoria]|uniref:ribonuclease P protein subunit Rpp21 n=1 Tax=Oratosquilla oratoria TaxID=337810 RepID=UPI003F76052A